MIGPARFARYAYPPNALGYCGPDEAETLASYVTVQRSHRELRHLARQFDGAWPYLELIAGIAGLDDPLHERVVEAYWVGNGLLDRTSPADIGCSSEDRFRLRIGHNWERVVEAAGLAAVPHHSYHVFVVYPWIGLLRSGIVDEPIRVLEQCRVRWGQVQDLDGPGVVVSSQPLQWKGGELVLGDWRNETVTCDPRIHRELAVGAWVSMHWDWICERLSAGQLRSLAHYSAHNLAIANATGSVGVAR